MTFTPYTPTQQTPRDISNEDPADLSLQGYDDSETGDAKQQRFSLIGLIANVLGAANIADIDSTLAGLSTAYTTASLSQVPRKTSGGWEFYTPSSGGGGIGLTDLSATAPIQYNNTTGVFSFNSSGFQPVDSDLTAIAALTTTAYGRDFLTVVDAAAAQTKLSLGTAATANATDFTASTTFTTHVAATGNGTHIPSGGITNAEVATGAAIAFAKLAGVQAALNTIATAVTFNDQAISRYSVETNAQTGTSYTLTASDNGRQIVVTNAAAITLTVPSGLPTGFNSLIVQGGAGVITVTAGASVTLNQRESKFKTAGLHAIVSLLPTSTANTYRLCGDLST